MLCNDDGRVWSVIVAVGYLIGNLTLKVVVIVIVVAAAAGLGRDIRVYRRIIIDMILKVILDTSLNIVQCNMIVQWRV